MINIRTRLLVGYGYMMVLLLLTAGSAAFGFFTISEAIDRILQENFRSVAASAEMMNSLERQNVVTMEALLEQEIDHDELEAADVAFRTALSTAQDNVTITGEGELLADLEASFERFLVARDRALTEEFEGLPLRLFATQLFPAYVEVREHAAQLLEMNHQAIIAADREARDTALQMAGWLGFLVTLALLSMVFLARALQQRILSRLLELTEVAESLITGDQSRRFEAAVNDELGLVARQLNAALDARDELQAEMRGRLNQQKQLVLGLLDEVQGNLLLLGLDGQLIASNSPEFEETNLEPVRRWLLDNRRFVLQSFREGNKDLALKAQPGGMPLTIRLLAAEGRRPVGWLIQFRPSEEVEEASEWVKEESKFYEDSQE